jgi:hypothetical protein
MFLLQVVRIELYKLQNRTMYVFVQAHSKHYKNASQLFLTGDRYRSIQSAAIDCVQPTFWHVEDGMLRIR